MSVPPVDGTPLVLYYGPNSEAVADDWGETERSFALAAVGPGEDIQSPLLDEQVDCVVCYGEAGDGIDVHTAIENVRAVAETIPIVVFAADTAFDATAALDLDVTQYVDVGADFDAIQRLEQLTTLVERTRRDRREQSMLDSLLTYIPLSVYFKDREGRHVQVSDDLTTMIGPPHLEGPDGKRYHTAEDVVGQTDFDLYPADLAEETFEDDKSVVETGEPIDERIERSAGGELDGTFVATSKAPWYDAEGRVAGIVGVSRDITERKQYEHQLERQNERLERFASVISHDLRNPLEVAFGRLEFAEKTGEAKHFEATERALDRMNALIDDVLTLARQGETVSDPQPISLAEAAKNAWAMVQPPTATLTVETEMTVLADPGRLQQLFENVFRNAIEHGGDDVEVTVGSLDDGPGFFVVDDGPGIPEDERAEVFDSGYSTGDEGTGLGLSIVRTIAEAHGWTVNATESATGGARFEWSQVQQPVGE